MLQPKDILAQLNADELRKRLDQLDCDRAALLVLLRAARARQRSDARWKRQQSGGKGSGREDTGGSD
jgi:hypothetical protein